MSKLFEPITVGKNTLDHRIVMLPLTRNRADPITLAPNKHHVEYYKQRSTKGGLIITEATYIGPQTIAEHHVPGIWTELQTQRWKDVVDAIHGEGAYVSMQLWHVGRVAHPSFSQHPLAVESGAIVSESASDVTYGGQGTLYPDGNAKGPHTPPHSMTLDDIQRVKQQYITAAHNAINIAGCDYIEVHSAHGYLLDQFINNHTNKRTDQYGGSIENRIRLTLEVVDELVSIHGSDKIGIRISPHRPTEGYFGVDDDHPESVYTTLASELSKRKLAYVLYTEPRWALTFSGDMVNDPSFHMPFYSINIRNGTAYNNAIVEPHLAIGSAGFSPQLAENTVGDDRLTDFNMIGVGRWIISNPDYVYRVKHHLPLNRYNRSTFYGNGMKNTDEEYSIGYTDYPTIRQIVDMYLGTDVDIEKDVVGNNDVIDKLCQKTADQPWGLVRIEQMGNTSTLAHMNLDNKAKI